MQASHFVMFPNWLARCGTTLNNGQLRVLLALSSHVYVRADGCRAKEWFHVPLDTLAADTAMRKSYISACITQLEKLGLVTTRKRGIANWYQMTWRDTVPAPAQVDDAADADAVETDAAIAAAPPVQLKQTESTRPVPTVRYTTPNSSTVPYKQFVSVELIKERKKKEEEIHKQSSTAQTNDAVQHDTVPALRQRKEQPGMLPQHDKQPVPLFEQKNTNDPTPDAVCTLMVQHADTLFTPHEREYAYILASKLVKLFTAPVVQQAITYILAHEHVYGYANLEAALRQYTNERVSNGGRTDERRTDTARHPESDQPERGQRNGNTGWHGRTNVATADRASSPNAHRAYAQQLASTEPVHRGHSQRQLDTYAKA